jgi:uncharacterized repeat protein (TIGR01451 family)
MIELGILWSLVTLARVPATSVRAQATLLRLLSIALGTALLLGLGAPSAAAADAPWLQINSEAVPTYMPPGGEAEIVVAASNLGDVPLNAEKNPVVITDQLPKGLTAVAIKGTIKNGTEVVCPKGELPVPPLSCSYAGIVNPYERIVFTVKVRVQEPSGTIATLANEVTAEGGGIGRVSSTQRLTVNGEPTPFGVQDYELSPLNADGTPATQAGAHPFQLTTTLVMNQTIQINGRQPVSLPDDLRFNLPPGLIGRPNATPQCSEVDFAGLVDETNVCPPSTAIGVATVVANEPATVHLITKTVPVFNLVPARGEPARFGLEIAGRIPIIIDTSVRSGRDYGVVATVKNTTQAAGLLSSQVTLWGVPGDPRHNNARGWECVAGGAWDNQIGKTCPSSLELPQEAFLTMPTSCPPDPASEPLSSSMEADSWAQPGSFLSAEYAWMSAAGQGLGPEGCSQLPFTPSIKVSPEAHSASTPTGLSVNVEAPQRTTLEANGLAEADIRDTTVTLPEGVELSPSAANGLQACSEQQIGFTGFNPGTETNEFNTAAPSCPEASKVGLVHIKTPLLPHELEGAVYLASPAPNGQSEPGRNPFNSLVALYIVAEDPVSGVLVKLAGEGQLSEGTLRVSTAFRNTPQVPFEDLRLELFGGPRASLTTPPLCGQYATEAAFTPWSGTGTLNVAAPAEEFDITSGANGQTCAGAPLAFAPGFDAQSTNRQAAAFTNFGLELSRPDGDQALHTVVMHLPPGNAALLSSVTLCSEAQATADSCPPDSLIGEAIAIAGLGEEPYTETGGKVYITGPYGGAPFGLEIVSPAVAGPFDLGTVTVRSKLYVNPNDASITIVSDPLPTQLRGIPLQLKRVLVNINRANFEFNPTNCDPTHIEGTITGAEGASASVSSPFQVSGCQNLPFAPTLAAAASGHASKANGASLIVKVTSQGLGQANIAKVDLQLPKQLPSRLPTIQKACLASVFEADPAACDEGSLIGNATIHTPVLNNPLTGPAYLVSHGNAAFPDVEFVLQGEGITLILDGKTQIKKGITYSKFESAPDAPFTTFETVLPAGPHSALTANVAESKHFDLCGETLQMPTTITAQNGDVIEQHTRIAVQGCAAVKGVKAKKLTSAQKLARALAACRKRYKHAKTRRVACARRARNQYGGSR